MPQFLLVDGPLAGQTLTFDDAPGRGEHVEVVGEPGRPGAGHGYVVESPAQWRRPGRLRHEHLAVRAAPELTRPA